MGKRLINHHSSLAFLIGKKIASVESDYDYWSLEKNDFPMLERTQIEYYEYFKKLINDITQKALLQPIKTKEMRGFLRRAELFAQMLIWTSYNRGKVALWDDQFYLKSTLKEQRYKYEGKYMWKVAGADACPICLALAGLLADSYYLLPPYPQHPNCRCQIVAVPTVAVVTKQQKLAAMIAGGILVTAQQQQDQMKKKKYIDDHYNVQSLTLRDLLDRYDLR